MKKLIKLIKMFILTSTLLLAGCNNKDAKGYVIEKNHRDPFHTTLITFIHVNKTMIPVTYLIYHAESWSLELDEDQDGDRDYTVYLKDPEQWETIEIGDYFCWDCETCYECEQTTKERQE